MRLRPGNSRNRSLIAIMLTFMLVLAACSGGNGNGNAGNAPADSANTPSTNEKSDTGTNKGANAGTNAGTNEETQTPAPSDDKEPVTLKLLTWFVGPNQKLFDKFHEMYPWITIEANTKIDGGIINNVIAGEEADLVFLDNGLSQWMAGDLLEDLTPYIENDVRIQNADKIDGLLESFQTGGKQYTVPYSDIPMWIVINKDLMNKYGLTMPGNDWTYDDMLEMAKKATDPAANDWGMIGMDIADIMAMANGNAGNWRLMSNDNTQSVADTPGVLEDLKWQQDLVHKWHVKPSKEEAEKLGFAGDPGAEFLKGNFLFMLGADWYLEGLNKDAKFEWDVLPMPKGKVQQATIHQAGAISIPKASKHKEEAFLYISFLFDIAAQKAMIENGSGAFVKSPELEKYYEEVPMWKGKNVEAIKMAGNMCCFSSDPNMVDLPEYMNTVVAAISKAMNDGSNLNAIIPAVEAYNKKALETRKNLGW
ncbi:extracellular solute-binding protein [Paenibacillus spongiae]|uniref:Extracellular solute-binding protein n=1 Tax=Paenibacillus spongiae TaxID=2909671 RepID=A0ABY5S424_9BACL|nr:extracellular solute-binding protein [Paenibacillus spongiae]UVI27300.1 extracellular solute-binding protein [Paenibacillus spongiae]